MPVYTVHGPLSRGARPSSDRIVFVRDGFSFWAFLLGPFWAMRHRLWWVLLGYLVLMVGISLAMNALHLALDVRFMVGLMIAFLMGLEAASLRRWALSRGQWRQLDVVVATDRAAAEQRFFDRWAGRSLAGDAQDRGAPPPTRPPPYAPAPREDIIGLFPQPGGAPR